MTWRAANSPPGRVGHARILIVEDEFLIASECEFVLTEAQHEVVGIAPDEPRAFALAEATRPDLALVDLRLARGGNGITVARQLLERWGIRSVFVSAHGEPATRERARPARPLGWLVKPYTADALLRVVEQSLSHLQRSSAT